MQSTPQTEFNDEQNRLITSLAVKMRSVGMFVVVLGLVLAVQAVMAGLKVASGEVSSPDHVGRWLKWLPTVILAVCAAIFLAIGFWSRSSGASFLKIVTTQNRDVWHLGNALSSQYNMFSLLNTLVVIALIVLIASLALHLFSKGA